VRVLVTDGEERAGLAVCRALAGAGHSVTLAASRAAAPGHWSRSCARRVRAPSALHGEGFVAAIAAALRSGGCDALLVGSDAALRAISAARAALPEDVLLGLPPHEIVLRSLDKDVLRLEAARAGLAQPRTVTCPSVGAALDVADEIGFPLIVKPPQSLVGGAQTLRRVPARLARGRIELEHAIGAAGGAALLQRFHHDASVLSFAGVCLPARFAGLLSARWLRRWPPCAGAASFCETESPPAALVDAAHALLRNIGWQGIFELELLDLGGGRFAAIDLNPRPFGWMTLALRAGVNLPAAWLDWLGGLEPPSLVARAGVRYRWEEGDLRHLVWQARRGRTRAALDVLRPRRRVAHAYFELLDPLPLAAGIVDGAVRASRRRGSRGLTTPATAAEAAGRGSGG
jgi:predicted ATP-grasp superfamily ATP-dependent carboligase